jgi:hypothetical protein
MGMSIVTIVVALVAALIAWKVLSGVIKLAVIAAIAVAAFYFLSQGGL